ncbi:tyrosine-type recombinase/integrase [Cellvibrio mixtus]|uniref:tyrosine-type recombinase/integrase n=1 Tax=Cellvibrio mixtus TaxID=39650 RepID=UPI000693D76C|nr:tyrosine-type recombinase/integrase [Cellvibrio mixtus]
MANHAVKTKLSTSKFKTEIKSAYSIYLDSLAPTGRKSMKTLLQQCASILGHEKPIERFDWSTLTFEKVQLIRSIFTEAGYAVSSINLTLAGLKGVAKTAFNLGQINADTLLRINSVKTLKGNATRTGRRLSNTEITKLLEGCNKITCPTARSRDRAILLVGIGAGLRCSEICSLDVGDIDIKNGVLTVMEGKGRKHRQIFLAAEVIAALKEWKQYRHSSSSALFCKIIKSGKVIDNRLSPSGLDYMLTSLQALSGVEKFTPHDLRRTFITQLLEKGVDLNTVRQLAGHSDVSTTTRYDKRDMAWQKEASQGISFSRTSL